MLARACLAVFLLSIVLAPCLCDILDEETFPIDPYPLKELLDKINKVANPGISSGNIANINSQIAAVVFFTVEPTRIVQVTGSNTVVVKELVCTNGLLYFVDYSVDNDPEIMVHAVNIQGYNPGLVAMIVDTTTKPEKWWNVEFGIPESWQDNPCDRSFIDSGTQVFFVTNGKICNRQTFSQQVNRFSENFEERKFRNDSFLSIEL